MSIEALHTDPEIPLEVLHHPELAHLAGFGLAAVGIVIAARWAYNRLLRPTG